MAATLLAPAGLASAQPYAGAAASAPGEAVHLTLPAPTGPYPIGTVSLHLVDRARPDPWSASQPYRELMVSVRYPARDADRFPPAPQMSPGEAAGFDAMNNLQDVVPAGRVDWSATSTHAHVGAPVDRRGGPRPVVLYSPGAGDPRSLGTTLADDLASRGYIVVTIDHTYETPAVEFPGGRVEKSRMLEEFTKAQSEQRVPELLQKVTAVRVADTRFVLDQLTVLALGRNPDVEHRKLPQALGGALDLARIGMLGHSAGGFTAVQTMHDDARIKAGVNMDGVLGYVQDDSDPSNPSSAATDGLDRPVLLMGHQGNDHHTSPSWNALWEHSSGWRRDLTLNGSQHASFTDAESLLPQIAGPLGIPQSTVTAKIGSIAPDRAVAAEEAYISAFFDRWLRGRDTHLLDGPSPDHPEMRFVP